MADKGQQIGKEVFHPRYPIVKNLFADWNAKEIRRFGIRGFSIKNCGFSIYSIPKKFAICILPFARSHLHSTEVENAELVFSIFIIFSLLTGLWEAPSCLKLA
jgi:hypothetical protein